MDYVADTVALIRFVTGSSNIGKTALQIMLAVNDESKDDQIIVSSVSLMEILYNYEKKRIPCNPIDIIEQIDRHPRFFILSMDENIIKSASLIGNLELHDRMIVATAKYLGAPLITCDQKIIDSNIVKTIW